MNGYLDIHAIKRALSGKVDHLNTFLTPDAQFTSSEIRDMLNALADDLVMQANRDPHKVAADLLTDGGESTDNDGVTTRHDAAWFAVHKIHAIKTIRTLTGSGLKEAKDAFEQMLPVYYKKAAEKALRELEAANRSAGFRYAEYVSASTHHRVINSDDVPF